MEQDFVRTYVPEDQRDSRWYVWYSMYLVRVPMMSNMSMDYIRTHGVPTSGDPLIDAGITRAKVTRMMYISEMIEFFERGVTVGVVNHEDTKKIYDHVSNHLKAWQTLLNRAWSVRDAPLDDLALMDKFAHAIYEHAQWHFETPEMVSLLGQRLQQVGMVTRDAILAPAKEFSRTGDIAEQEIKEGEKRQSRFGPRTSMADAFSNRQLAGRPKWK